VADSGWRNWFISFGFDGRDELIDECIAGEITGCGRRALVQPFWQTAWPADAIYRAPTPPWTNNGLYALPGCSATATLAACASALHRAGHKLFECVIRINNSGLITFIEDSTAGRFSQWKLTADQSPGAA